MTEDQMFMMVPAIVGLVAILLGYWLRWIERFGAIFAFLGAVAVVAAFLIIQMVQVSGWDAIAYVVLLIGIVAPAAAGFLIGILIAWLRRRAKVTDVE